MLRSNDGGRIWSDSGLPVDSAYFVALAPASQTIYAAGCCTTPPFSISKPALFRSTDGGVTWVDTGGIPARGIDVLLIDAQDPSTLYATNLAGIFKSTDAGRTWQEADSGAATVSQHGEFYVPVLGQDPQNSGTLYAARVNSDGTDGGIYKTTDGGDNWSAMDVSWGAHLYDVSAIVVDSRRPMVLYAGTRQLDCADYYCSPDYYNQLASAPGTGVFKTTDGGKSWVKLNLPAGDVSALTNDPADPATLYAVLGYYPGSKVYRSTDSGATWNSLDSGLAPATISGLVVDGRKPSTVYAGTYGGGVFAITFPKQ
jgi:photosystem II stability/assembly factor-like uncharacterized protein